ncbi:hypothetical protein HY373_02065, partial [Candidatus Berkelbacteria bacterium]|nr:hypothetical protein [Candidatus Berkelbacteria bacterium]
MISVANEKTPPEDDKISRIRDFLGLPVPDECPFSGFEHLSEIWTRHDPRYCSVCRLAISDALRRLNPSQILPPQDNDKTEILVAAVVEAVVEEITGIVTALLGEITGRS